MKRAAFLRSLLHERGIKGLSWPFSFSLVADVGSWFGGGAVCGVFSGDLGGRLGGGRLFWALGDSATGSSGRRHLPGWGQRAAGAAAVRSGAPCSRSSSLIAVGSGRADIWRG